MSRISQELKAKCISFLEQHMEDIKYAKKGYIQQLTKQFQEEIGETIKDSQLQRILTTFRLTHNCPIEYIPNKYYAPAKHESNFNYRTSVQSSDK